MTKIDAKKLARYFLALMETVGSALLMVALYAVYLPFAILRAMSDRAAIRAFYEDVAAILDRMRSEERRIE